MLQAFTVEDIVKTILSLDLDSAVVGTTINEQRCSTPLIECVLIEGAAVPLEQVNDELGYQRYGAGYVRVSTPTQNLLGFSIGDQVKRCVEYFVDQRLAFRIFNDAGLSGSLPYLDNHVIANMIEAKVSRYRTIFKTIFLNRVRRSKYTQAQEQSVRDYLENKIVQIRKNNAIDELNLKPKTRQRLPFRPALTVLLHELPNIHTILVNDLSRLSRNQYLFSEIANQIEQSNTIVRGAMESSDFANEADDEVESSGDLSREIQLRLLPKVAEYRLTETILASMRGLLEMIEQGKPHSALPCWLKRIEAGPGVAKEQVGRAVFKEGADKSIRRLIEIFLEPDCQHHHLLHRLEKEGVPCPSKSGVWNNDNIGVIMETRALVGYETAFGLEFPIFPALIDEKTWLKVQAKWQNRDKKKFPFLQTARWDAESGTRIKSKKLGTGLVKCICHNSAQKGVGGSLIHKPAFSKYEKDTWVCGNTRRKKGIKHIRLTDKNLTDFIDGMMSGYRVTILQEFQKKVDFQILHQQLYEIEKQIANLEAKVELRQLELRTKAEMRAKLTQMANWKALIPLILEGLLEEENFDEQRNQLKLESLSLRRQLTNHVPNQHIENIQNNIVRWHELDVYAKNDLLQSVFQGWYFERLNDSDFALQMVMVMWGGKKLPPVSIKVSGTPHRRMIEIPTIDDYKRDNLMRHGTFNVP